MSLAMKKCKANTFPVTTIEISINDGVITMFNDGNGIDIAKHPENNLWIPEMIFGHLRTSTNYDKTEKKGYIYLPVGRQLFKINSNSGDLEKNFGKGGYISIATTKFSPIIFEEKYEVLSFC